MDKESFTIYKYSFIQEKGIKKQKLTLELKMICYHGKVYTCNDKNNSTVFERQIDNFNSTALYFTQERDDEVIALFKEKVKKSLLKVEQDYKRLKKNSKVIKIIEEGDL